jgi:hypothetical protein
MEDWRKVEYTIFALKFVKVFLAVARAGAENRWIADLRGRPPLAIARISNKC